MKKEIKCKVFKFGSEYKKCLHLDDFKRYFSEWLSKNPSVIDITGKIDKYELLRLTGIVVMLRDKSKYANYVMLSNIESAIAEGRLFIDDVPGTAEKKECVELQRQILLKMTELCERFKDYCDISSNK